jgi:hypothetical protein
MKLCYICKINESLNSSRCKTCNTEYFKKYREKNEKKIKTYKKEYYYLEFKESINDKNHRYYEKNKESVNKRNKEYYTNNKEKVRKINDLWMEENKEKVTIYQAAYRKENSDKTASYNKKYKIKNKKDLTLKRRNYENNRLANDPFYRVKKNIRRSINRAIKTSNWRKTKITEIILGCTFSALVTHLKVTWEKNYPGEILNWSKNVHIDHIIPLVTAKTLNDVYLLNHHSNLQLLKAFDNIKKGGKVLNP